ncbi:hypothetical protein MASR2M66_29990 [Chloroflexota bacterium]
MKSAAQSLTLLVIFGLILTSCKGAATDPSLPLLATPALDNSSLVNVELAVQYDSAAVYNTVGQIIRFKYIITMVRNDMAENIPPNVTISGIIASCPPLNTVSNMNERFDPGEVLECTGDYLLTQADLDHGSVTNAATANVYGVNSNTALTTVPTVSGKALTLAKTANTSTYSSVDQEIIFTYTITNSGSIPLGPAQFTVADSFINNHTPFNCGNADASLAPGATLTCTAIYKVTAADLTAASISSSSTAEGGGASPSQPVSVTLTKTAPASGASGTSVQHTIRDGEWLWQIARCYGTDPKQTVEANPQVNPTALKAGMVVTVPNVGSKGTVHGPSELCVKLHTVQANETWTSIADLYGADPGLTQMSNLNVLVVGKTVKVPLYTKGLNIPLVNTPNNTTPTAGLGLTVTPSSTTYSQVGQSITFTYVITNNGSTALGPTQFIITDPFMAPATLDCGSASTMLTPGTSTTCSSAHSITQADMDAASIQFSSTASGAGGPGSTTVITTLTKGIAQITLNITATPNTYTQAGQVVTFNYIIKNTGTSPLGPTQFIVTSSFLNPETFNCGAGNISLAPNAEVTCSASYTVTAADLSVVNIQFSATASGGGVTSQTVPVTLTKQ